MDLKIDLESADNGYILRCKKSDGTTLNRVYSNIRELRKHFPGIAEALSKDFETLNTVEQDVSFEEYQINNGKEEI